MVLAGRREEPLQVTARAVEELGSSALVVRADVGEPESVNELFRKTEERFGRIDVLFNNAGIGAPPVPMEELSFTQWKAVVDTNLTGSFLCAQHAMRFNENAKTNGRANYQ